jgi:hypothetical protein
MDAMTDAVKVALIMSVPGMAAVAVSAIGIMRTNKVGTSVNGRMGELIAAVKENAHTQGMKDEKDAAGRKLGNGFDQRGASKEGCEQ